jgi:hypothetical protein
MGVLLRDGWRSIVVSRLCEEDAVVFDLIDEAVFLGDAAGPDSRAEVAEGFGFADAGEWIAANGFDEFEDAEGGFAIRVYPVGEVIEEVPVEDELAFDRGH